MAEVAARVQKTTAQTLSTNTDTVISFDTENYDTASMHSNATNNSRITVPADGRYAITALLRYASTTSGQRTIILRKNGSAEQLTITVLPVAESVTTRVLLATDLQLVAGDYLEILGHQSSGGNLDVQTTDTFFAVRL